MREYVAIREAGVSHAEALAAGGTQQEQSTTTEEFYMSDSIRDSITTSDGAVDGYAVRVESIVDSLQARADNAYVDYIDRLRSDECLGWQIKAKRGLFREPELRAHTAAAEMLGRHLALCEAAQLLRDILPALDGVVSRRR